MLYQSLFDFTNIPKLYVVKRCCKTVKPCNRPAVGAHKLGQMEFIDVFPFILTRIMPGCFPQVVQKHTLGEVEN